MKHHATIRTAAVALLFSLVSGGCAGDAVTPTQGLDSLAGTVVSLRDDLPLDGDAELWIRDERDGEARRAYVPSQFIYPPPGPEALAAAARVMPVFHSLQVGDHVAAQGHADDGGLRLEFLFRR